MPNWNNSLDKLDVRTGDIWALGKHTYICGNATDRDVQRALIESVDGKVDLLYSDPPWNTGNLKMFYGYAGTNLNNSFDDFLVKIYEFVNRLNPDVLSLETSVKIETHFHDAFFPDYSYKRRYTTLYGSKKTPRKCSTWVYANKDCPEMPENLYGDEVISWVMDNLQTKAVGANYVDVCAGKLHFSRAAMRRGFVCHGTEIIAGKLAQGLLSASKEFDLELEKVGTI